MPLPRPLILASTSPYRQALLMRLGLPFVAVKPLYEEAPLALPPAETAREQARRKAHSLRGVYPEALIIGCDQVCALNGECLGKPGSYEAAAQQLRRLGGREHELLTALCLLDAASGEERLELDVHRLRMRPLSDAQIAHYLDRDQPFDCAGAYKLESLGIALFAEITGSDDSAVVGLPLLPLVRCLAEWKIDPLLPY